MERTPRIRGIPPELAVAALVGAASVPLARLFRPGRLGGVVILTLVTSAVLAAALRRMGIAAPFSLAWTSAGFGWFASALFHRDTLWGPFPTLESLRAFGSALDEGARQIAEEVAPVDPTDPLLLFVAAGVWISAWLVDTATFGARNPLLGVASAVPLFAVAGGLVASDRLWAEAGLFLLAAAWLLFSDQRARTLVEEDPGDPLRGRRAGWPAGPAARLGIIAVVVAVAAGPLLPGYGDPPGLRARRGSRGRITFNPLVAIKPTLDFAPDRALFRVRTPELTYHRLTALDSFDGAVWTQSREAPDLAGGFPNASTVTQEYEIIRLGGPWIPAAFQARSVEPQGATFQEDLDTFVLKRALRSGDRFTVTSRVPHFTAAGLDAPVTYDAGAVGPYLALRGPEVETIRRIARTIAGDEPNAFRKAVALQEHLRSAPFQYDVQVAAGHDFDTIVEFLVETRRGYCEQFAATMAVLARALGIPSRVAIGFAPGERIAPDVYEVSTEEAHAWVELWFPQGGWVAFEPTPRAGVVRAPSYTQLESLAPGVTDPGGDERTEPEPTGEPSPDRPFEDPLAEGRTAGAEGTSRWVLAGVAAGGLLAALLLLPFVAAAVRRLRLRRARGTAAVVARYVDYLRWCAAAGLGRAAGETPAEHARRVGTGDPAPVERAAGVVTEALWAPPNGLDAEGAVRAIAEARGELARSLPRRRRAIAAAGWGRWRG